MDSNAVPRTSPETLQKLIGLLLTMMAISFGAPFWFDMLNRVTVIRSALKPQQSEPSRRPVASSSR
jgi:hypothetical protein